jgi:hypothetical protein
MSKVALSKHAKKRMKERTSLSNNQINSTVEKILKYGISHGDVSSGDLKKYFDLIYLQHNKSTKTRIYGNYVYCISSNNVIITLFELPINLRKRSKAIQLKKHKKLIIKDGGVIENA